MSDKGIVLLNAETLAVESTLPFDVVPKPVCGVVYMEGTRALIGTQTGELLEIMAR